MLDRVMIKHLDGMSDIEDKIEASLDKMFKNINIDAILDNPQAAMIELIEVFQEMMADDVIPLSVKQGQSLAEQIKKLRKGEKIEIPDSNDPNLNKENASDIGIV